MTLSTMLRPLLLCLLFEEARAANVIAKSGSPLGTYSRAAVAADNGACSEIGNSILKKGGNAVESIIATAICIGVMDSHSSGLGGGHFMTVYNKNSKSCTTFDARERAPILVNETLYEQNPNLTQTGWLAIAVPGELHGFWTAYRQFRGTVSWADLWLPTIEMCRKGIKISPALGKAIKDNAPIIKNNAHFKDFINDTGHPKVEGDTAKLLKLADTMEKISLAKDPIKFFYDSNWTERIVQEIKDNGGIITREDFRNYTTRFGDQRPPIYSRLRNSLTFCAPPPPSSGSLVSSIVNVLDAFKISPFDKRNRTATALLYHRFLEATKFAYGVRNKLGDMDFIDSAYQSANSANFRTYANFIREKITSKSMRDSLFYGSTSVKWDHGTAHVSVIDQFGNAASLTSSINLYFGSKIRSNVTGIFYNNEMDDFSISTVNYFQIEPSPENRMQPGKRPQSSMAPIIAFDNGTGDAVMAIGAAGGVKIIAAVAHVIMRLLYLNETIKEAIEAPRIFNQLIPYISTYEQGFPQDILKDLRDLYGQPLDSRDSPFGSVVCAVRRLKNGSLEANSDYRKGGGYTAGL